MIEWTRITPLSVGAQLAHEDSFAGNVRMLELEDRSNVHV